MVIIGLNMKYIAASVLVIVVAIGSIDCAPVDNCPQSLLMMFHNENGSSCLSKVLNETTNQTLIDHVTFGVAKFLKLDMLFASNVQVQLTDDEKNKVLLVLLCHAKSIFKRSPVMGAIVYDCNVKYSAGDVNNIGRCSLERLAKVCQIDQRKRSVSSPIEEVLNYFLTGMVLH